MFLENENDRYFRTGRRYIIAQCQRSSDAKLGEQAKRSTRPDGDNTQGTKPPDNMNDNGQQTIHSFDFDMSFPYLPAA